MSKECKNLRTKEIVVACKVCGCFYVSDGVVGVGLSQYSSKLSI